MTGGFWKTWVLEASPPFTLEIIKTPQSQCLVKFHCDLTRPISSQKVGKSPKFQGNLGRGEFFLVRSQNGRDRKPKEIRFSLSKLFVMSFPTPRQKRDEEELKILNLKFAEYISEELAENQLNPSRPCGPVRLTSLEFNTAAMLVATMKNLPFRWCFSTS